MKVLYIYLFIVFIYLGSRLAFYLFLLWMCPLQLVFAADEISFGGSKKLFYFSLLSVYTVYIYCIYGLHLPNFLSLSSPL